MPRKAASTVGKSKVNAPDGPDLLDITKEFRLLWGTWPDWTIYGSASTQLVIRCDVVVLDENDKQHTFWAERVWTPSSASILTLMLQTGHMVYHEVDRMFLRMAEKKEMGL